MVDMAEGGRFGGRRTGGCGRATEVRGKGVQRRREYPTFVIFFCFTNIAFRGAIVRAPFLGPSTLGLRVSVVHSKQRLSWSGV